MNTKRVPPAGIRSVLSSVHHYWVTDAGDTIFVAPAQLTAFPLPRAVRVLLRIQLSITGGTGKLQGATGNLNVIGEADFNSGEIGLGTADELLRLRGVNRGRLTARRVFSSSMSWRKRRSLED